VPEYAVYVPSAAVGLRLRSAAETFSPGISPYVGPYVVSQVILGGCVYIRISEGSLNGQEPPSGAWAPLSPSPKEGALVLNLLTLECELLVRKKGSVGERGTGGGGRRGIIGWLWYSCFGPLRSASMRSNMSLEPVGLGEAGRPMVGRTSNLLLFPWMLWGD